LGQQISYPESSSTSWIHSFRGTEVQIGKKERKQKQKQKQKQTKRKTKTNQKGKGKRERESKTNKLSTLKRTVVFAFPPLTKTKGKKGKGKTKKQRRKSAIAKPEGKVPFLFADETNKSFTNIAVAYRYWRG